MFPVPGVPHTERPGYAGINRTDSVTFFKRLPVIAVLFSLVLVIPGCIETQKEAPSDIEEARQAMLARDYLEAEKSFERYLRRNPEGSERWDVWNSLVDLALSVRNDRKAAVELMEAMLIEYAGSPARKRIISAHLGEQYRLARKYERALELWSSVAEDKDADVVERARACRGLANIYMRRLEFELAKESLGYCLALEVPDTIRAQCLYDLAQTHSAMGEPEKAAGYFRSVLSLNYIPDTMRTLTVFMLADTLEQDNKPKEALELYTSISETYPNPKVVEQRIAFLKDKKKSPPPTGGKK